MEAAEAIIAAAVPAEDQSVAAAETESPAPQVIQKSASVDLPKPEVVQNEVIFVNLMNEISSTSC